MSEIHVVALITPSVGSSDKVKEALSVLAKSIEKDEPGVMKYQIFEQVHADGENVYVVEEIYKNQAVFEAHFKTEHFQALGKKFTEESLLAAAPDIKTIVPFAGFASR